MIVIKPHTGIARNGERIDTGIDAIWLIEPNRPDTRIGMIGRKAGAPLQLTRSVSDSIISEAKRAATEQDIANAPEEMKAAIESAPREVQQAPTIEQIRSATGKRKRKPKAKK